MLNSEESILVVIDVQGKLVHVVEDSSLILTNIQKLIMGAQALNIPIIVTNQVPEKLGTTTPEIAELLPEVEPISRTSFSCLREIQFMVRLNELACKQIILCGLEAHICLYQSALDLLEAGYEVYYVVDAISARAAVNKQTAITRVIAAGAKLTTVEMLLFEMLRDARHPAFKAIAKIIK
ncbi:MAG: hydrolase [Chloroflexota bacterium]